MGEVQGHTSDANSRGVDPTGVTSPPPQRKKKPFYKSRALKHILSPEINIQIEGTPKFVRVWWFS